MTENTIQVTLTGAETRLVSKAETDKWNVAVNRYDNFNHVRNSPPDEKGWLGHSFRPHEDDIRGEHFHEQVANHGDEILAEMEELVEEVKRKYDR